MDLLFNLLFILIIYPLNNFIKLKNFLPNRTGEKHQSFASKDNVPFIWRSIYFYSFNLYF